MHLPPWGPTAISIFALLISLLSLSWNIYSGWIYQGRLHFSIRIKQVTDVGKRGEFLVFEFFNKGRQPVACAFMVFESRGWLKRLGKRSHEDMFVAKDQHPKKLEPGGFYFFMEPYGPDCMLKSGYKRIGMKDRLGRIHWASRSDLRKAMVRYQKDFGESRTPAPTAD